MKRALLTELRRVLKHELSRMKRRRGSSVFVVVVLTIGVFAIDHYLQEADAPIPNQGAQLDCEVRKVSDGDTVTVGCEQGRMTVRVWGIDAPESGQKPWGDQSRQYLASLLSDDSVTVEIFDEDHYGRAVAKLYANNQDAGLTMIKQGKAVVYQQYNDSQIYRDAERQAKTAKLGVWSKSGAQQAPWEWRKVNARND